MSDMPKIPEHAKIRVFHGGYPDEPAATPNAPTAAEVNIRQCEKCGRLTAPSGKPCAYCGPWTIAPAAEREGEATPPLLSADDREFWRSHYDALGHVTSTLSLRLYRAFTSAESALLAARRENDARLRQAITKYLDGANGQGKRSHMPYCPAGFPPMSPLRALDDRPCTCGLAELRAALAATPGEPCNRPDVSVKPTGDLP